MIIKYRHGHGSFKRPRRNNKNRSAKALNKRVPPARKKVSDNGCTKQKDGQGQNYKPFIPLASRQHLGIRKKWGNIGRKAQQAMEMEYLSTTDSNSDSGSSDGSISLPCNEDKEDGDAMHITYRF